MFTRRTQLLTLCLLPIILLATYGCEVNTDSCDRRVISAPDTTPPAIPRGVYSITSDEEVIIEWFPNGENDLAGYRVWRSGDNVDFEKIGEVLPDTASFVDRNVKNGKTYYYAVTAFDYDGNESDLSLELVDDTPRPEGRSVTLKDYQLSPERSGFDLSRPDRGAILWDDVDTDIYFGFDLDVNVSYMYSDNATLMQDMGYRDSMDDLDEAPLYDLGYTELFVELLKGHVYAFNTPDGNYAKIRVINVSDVSVTFDWAYQIDPDNPELAPTLSLKK
ncbi:hypothetical protein FJZ31_07465 [Candidatus Poribacteria bacterium]|nr:hypothetical protein [Candidatus Poribacteria bacterium]